MNQHPPFFIIGIARSGTTLLEKILDNHSLIGVCPESNTFKILKRVGGTDRFLSAWHYRYFMQSLASRLQNYNDPAFSIATQYLSQNPNYNKGFDQLLQILSKEYLNQKRKHFLGEKTPSHLFVLPTILKVVPNAQFIFIIRHPFDTICSLSKLMTLKNPQDIYTDDSILKSAALVKHGINTFYSPESEQINNKITIKYEDLVHNTTLELEKICSFLKVPFEENMIHFNAENYFQSSSGTQSIVHPNLTRPINSNSINSHQKHFNPSQIKLLQLFLKEELKKTPYSFTETASKISVLQYLLLLKHQLLFSLKSHLWQDYLVLFKIKVNYWLYRLK